MWTPHNIKTKKCKNLCKLGYEIPYTPYTEIDDPNAEKKLKDLSAGEIFTSLSKKMIHYAAGSLRVCYKRVC